MSPQPGFVHLHLHSEYSLLDGGNRLDRLIARVTELGMSAVAVTDHGNLYGAIEFYTKAKAAGIKPILGIEAYVALGDRSEKVQTGIADGGFHLVLLAENETGWRNLLKLSSDSFLNGFYYKPRMDKSTLTQWSEGLIAINGHIGSSIAHHLVLYAKSRKDEHWNDAVEEAQWHAKTFGTNDRGEPRFYLELQDYEIEGREENLQKLIRPHVIRLAEETGLPLVCDNDAHFLLASDYDVHDTLCCISMQKTKQDEGRLKYPRDLYVKSPAEMAQKFAALPEAMTNTVKIAERCNVDLDFSASHAPVVRVRKADEFDQNRVLKEPVSDVLEQTSVAIGSTEWFKAFCAQYELLPFDAMRDRDVAAEQLKDDCDRALRELAEAGLIWRYGETGVTDEIKARLERELSILADKNISAYFLIVWDFVNWARQRGIPANARGSGVGTMVGYVLGLSNACPVKYGLLFERFTDPDRSEYPDIDIDICQDGRGAVINYVREKYGHVAQIITFGRLKAKAAIKDVARVMGLPPVEGQRLSNLVPAELNITIDQALEKSEDFRNEYRNNAQATQVIDHARALENHARHAGVHAAGVVIATQPLDNIVPLCKASGGGNDDVVTQWDGPTCEKVGLLKMDFLGLRTLSTIERAKQLVRETLSEEAIWAAVQRRSDEATERRRDEHANRDVPPSSLSFDPLDLDRIPLDDQNVLELFRRGDTSGIFQFESGGMRQLLMEMQPDRLEDLIAANALYRPGPMDLIPNYNSRKHGRETVPTIHEIVDRFTDETYGIMVYQEQVMQIVHGLGDIPLRAAYSLIKAISKKKQKDIDAVRPKFIEGSMQKGLSKRQADDLFDLILKFAGYGFNKSHSTGYAIIAYQTAYLKTYFPNQYMAALLSFESQARKVEDWAPYLEDCKRTVFPDSTAERPHVGVKVLPPDINLSQADFTVVFGEDEPRDNLHGHIRFGLGAIKGAGHSAIRSIIGEREKDGAYASLFDFCERVDLRGVNKATIESLVKCGAFDSVHGRENRAAVVASIEDAVKAGQTAAEDRRAGQSTFFDSFMTAEAQAAPDKTETHALRRVTPWTELQSLQFEKEVLGFHASGHPLDMHERAMRSFTSHRIARLGEVADETPVILGGILTRVRQTFSKSGRNAGAKMAWIALQDRSGTIEGVVFSDVYSRFASLLEPDRALFVLGRIDRRRGEPSIVVDRLIRMEDATTELAACVEVDLPQAAKSGATAREGLETLRQALFDAAETGGRGAEVLINVEIETKLVTIRANMLRVAVREALLSQLAAVVGEGRVRVRGVAPEAVIAPRNGAGHANGNGGFNKWQQAKVNGSAADETCASIDRY